MSVAILVNNIAVLKSMGKLLTEKRQAVVDCMVG